MFIRFTPLLLLLFSVKVSAYEFPTEIIEYFDNVQIVAYLKKSDINDKLTWVPFESSPPLSINKALMAVKKYIKSDTSFSDITLTEIELKRLPHHKTLWHYLVKAKYSANGETKPHFFVVLMDGKVISAIKEPESIK